MKRRLYPNLAALLLAALLSGCRAELAAPGTIESGGAQISAAQTEAAAPTAAALAPGDARLSACERADGVTEAEALAVLGCLETYFGVTPEQMAAEGQRMRLYLSVPFEGGALVLADYPPAEEGAAPNLYCISSGEVTAVSRDADAGSINLARLNGRTILFGLAAGENAESVSASFFDGETRSAAVESALGESVFLLFADQCTDLAAITFFAGDEPVADETDARYAKYDAGLLSGMPAEIFTRVHLTALYAGGGDGGHPEVLIPGNEMDLYDWEFTWYDKHQLEWTPTDAFRNNNALWQRYTAKGGSSARIVNLPDDIVSCALVCAALDTGGDAAPLYTPLALSGEKITFPAVAAQTEYRLCVELDDAVYTLPVVLEP